MMRRDQGFVLIEVLVAITILAVGILTTMLALNSSRQLTLVAERQTSTAHRAQVELEYVKSLPYSQIGLTGTSSSWSSDVSAYTGVSGGSCPTVPTGTPPAYQPDHRSGGSTSTEPLLINGCTYTVNGASTVYTTGSIIPVKSWSDGRFSGNVYDFVTWTNDPNCGGSNCPQSNDYKRITIVVSLNGATHPSNPSIVSTYVADPNLNSPQDLFKSPSTSCTQSGQSSGPCSETITQTPIPLFPCDSSYSNNCGGGTWGNGGGGGGDVPTCTGNTLDQTLVSVGSTAPAPDAANESLPSGDCAGSGGSCTGSGCVPGQPPPCFASDVLSNCQGLPIVPVSTCSGSGCGTGGSCSGSGCGSGSSGDSVCGSTPPLDNTKSHSWVAPAIPTNNTVNLTGAGAMTTFLESPTTGSISGYLCMHLYVVPNTTLGTLNSLLATPIGASVAGSFTAQAGVPTPLTFNFNYGSATAVSATAAPVRIMFVIWVAGAASDVEMVYDQAQFASEVTLLTQ